MEDTVTAKLGIRAVRARERWEGREKMRRVGRCLSNNRQIDTHQGTHARTYIEREREREIARREREREREITEAKREVLTPHQGSRVADVYGVFDGHGGRDAALLVSRVRHILSRPLQMI